MRYDKRCIEQARSFDPACSANFHDVDYCMLFK